jgi:hypothetical protein
MVPTDDSGDGVPGAFIREYEKILKVMKDVTKETAEQKKNAKEASSAYNGDKVGGGKLGLGTMPLRSALSNFSGGEKMAMGAVAAGATFMSMAPNTMSAVAQRMYADSIAGLSGMKAQPLIRQANRMVNGATSAMGPTAAAANLYYQGGYSANSLSSKNIMQSLGGMSAITGGTNEQTASSLAGMNGMLFLRAGIRIRDNNGQLLPMEQIVNSVYRVLYGGRKVTLQQAALLLNPSSKGYQTLTIICGGDQNLQSAISMAVITRARKGTDLTKKDLGSAQNALTAMGVGGESPLRANFRYQAGQNAALQATEGGLVGGYNTSLNVVGALNQGFADLASALGPVTSGLMGLKGILQTFPNAGNMGGTISAAGSTAMGFASQAMNAAIMGRVLGVGRFAAGGGGTASLLAGGLRGGGSILSGMKMGLRGGGRFLGKAIPGLGALLSAMSGYGDSKANKGIWGGLLASAGTGALVGAGTGAMAGGVGAIPGALLGALISGGGYLGGRLLGSGGPDDEHHHGFGTGGGNDAGGQATFNLPVPKGTPVTSPYGPRKGGKGVSKNHHGIDFGVRENTNVTAAADGVVTEVGNGGGYGNYVIIKHGSKSTLYAHLNSSSVKVGQAVKGGQIIAKSGGRKGAPGAGASTGPHLHFEVRDNGGRGAQGRVNPAGFFGKAANFISNAFKAGINMAKSVGTFLTAPFRAGSQAISNMLGGNKRAPELSPTDLSGLNSPELRALLHDSIVAGRPLGSEDLKKYMTGMNNRKLKLSGGSKVLLDNKDDPMAPDGQMAGGSRAGLIKLLARHGFSGKNLETAFAVAAAESRGRAVDYNGKGRDKSYGLFQINMNNDDPKSPNMGRNRLKQFGIKNYNDLMNPEINAKAAYMVSTKGTSWKAWSTYNDGTFLRYLDDAQRAKETAGIGGPTGTDGMASVATQTKEPVTPHNVEVKVTMHVNIAQSGVREAEQMFRTFSKRVEEAIQKKQLGVY